MSPVPHALRVSILWSAILGVVLPVLSGALHWQLSGKTGLDRVVQDAESATILDEARAHTVDLDLLEQNPSFPRRRFSVSWSGLWYVPRGGFYGLMLVADDGARVWIDDRLVLERSLTSGVDTTRKTLSLNAGLHPIKVDYRHTDGEADLSLQWAPLRGELSALDPYALFPAETTPTVPRVSVLARRVWRATLLAWAVLGVAVVALVARHHPLEAPR